MNRKFFKYVSHPNLKSLEPEPVFAGIKADIIQFGWVETYQPQQASFPGSLFTEIIAESPTSCLSKA